MSAFNAGKQRLTLAEEHVVVNFCLESADRGFPLIHDNVYKYADNILSVHLGSEHDTLGLNWVTTILIWHHDELQDTLEQTTGYSARMSIESHQC